MQEDIKDHQIRLGRSFFSFAGWLFTTILVTIAYLALIRPDLRFWDGIRTHGNASRNEIALTFDDGPHPLWAPLLADSLERRNAYGSFFLVGLEAERYPEITARLAMAGHQIGNHSLTHPYPNLTFLPTTSIKKEIMSANKVLTQIARPFTGQSVHYFRPPGGGLNDAVIETLKENDLEIAWWSENAGDWSSPSPEVTAERLLASLRPGTVVLMHERENSVAALESLLAGHGEEEYTFTTIADIMR